MEELIKALTIMQKYLKGHYKYLPTICEHGSLIVCVDPGKISNDDREELDKLGFQSNGEYMVSYRYG